METSPAFEKGSLVIKPRVWKAGLVVLLVGIAVLVRVLWDKELEFSEATNYIRSYYFRKGLDDADADFRTNRIRLYVLEKIATGPYRSTGRKDGPFEVWTYPVSWAGLSKRVDLLRDSSYVDTYNTRMKILFSRHNTKRKPTAYDPNSPPPVPGLPLR